MGAGLRVSSGAGSSLVEGIDDKLTELARRYAELFRADVLRRVCGLERWQLARSRRR